MRLHIRGTVLLKRGNMTDYDVIVIGAGVVGSFIARELSRYKLHVLLIDKASDVGSAASAANSSLIHAGYDPLPGTLKAALNVRGNRMWETLAAELILTSTAAGLRRRRRRSRTTASERTAKARERKRRFGYGADLRRRDWRRVPQINPEASGALFAASAGITDPFAVTIAAAENALQNGVEIRLETEFQNFLIEKEQIVGIRTSAGNFSCRWVINAAGIYADEIMHQAGVRPDFQITPRRGEYCVLDPQNFAIDTVLFPVPNERGKGVLVFTTTHGNTVVGPTSEFIADKTDTAITHDGQAYLKENLQKLVPSIDLKWTIATFAGLRAAGNAVCANPMVNYNADFIVESAQEVIGLINCAGIESPGLSASPAIALMVTEILRENGMKLEQKADWNPIRRRRPIPRHMELEERGKLISQDPRYGRIVCRCEQVTEGEIVAEIHAPIPARTYDAIKRRTWTGTGRCQGGFDMVRVVEILARELGLPVEQVSKKGAGSELIRNVCEMKGSR